MKHSLLSLFSFLTNTPPAENNRSSLTVVSILYLIILVSSSSLYAQDIEVGLKTSLVTTSNTGGEESFFSNDDKVKVEKVTGNSSNFVFYTAGDKEMYYGSNTKYYSKACYNIKQSKSDFQTTDYVGYKVVVDPGNEYSLTTLKASIAASANINWKVDILTIGSDNTENIIYTTGKQTISNYNSVNATNYSIQDDLSSDYNLQHLTGTFYVRTYFCFSSSGKYFCFPELILSGILTSSSISGGDDNSQPEREPDYLLINQIDGSVNTADFRTTCTTTSTGYTVDNKKYNYEIKLGGAKETPIDVYEPNKIIAYDIKTNNVVIDAWFYNKSSTNYNFYISIIEEDQTRIIKTFEVPKNSGLKVQQEFTTTKNATIYIHNNNNSNLFICQVGVSENGNKLPWGGEVGYTIDLEHTRLGTNKQKNSLENIEYNVTNANTQIYNQIKLKNNTEYIKFKLEHKELVRIGVSTTTAYFVTKNNSPENLSNEVKYSESTELELEPGEWYIVPNGAEVKFKRLEFANAREVVKTEIELSNVSVNGEFISLNDLNNLKEKQTLTLDKSYIEAPTIVFTKKTTIRYEEGEDDITEENITVVMTENNGMWQAQISIEEYIYTIIANKQKTYTITYYRDNIELGTEIVEEGGNPKASAQYENMTLTTFKGWFKDKTLSEKIDDISTFIINENTEIYGDWELLYAWGTVDFGAEAQGKKTDVNTLLKNNNYAPSIGSGNSASYDTNPNGYVGYKLKNEGDKVEFWLQSGKKFAISVMYIETSLSVKIDDSKDDYIITNKDNGTTPKTEVIGPFEKDVFVTITNNSANKATSVLNKFEIIDSDPVEKVFYGRIKGEAKQARYNGVLGDYPFTIEYKAVWNEEDGSLTFDNVALLSTIPLPLVDGFVFQILDYYTNSGDPKNPIIYNELSLTDNGGYSATLNTFPKDLTGDKFKFRVVYAGGGDVWNSEYVTGSANNISEGWPVEEIKDYNLALKFAGATATANYFTTEGDYKTEYAIDGKDNTRWASERGNDEQELIIDLGKQRIFNMVQILWEGAYAKSFNIDISNDKESWENIKTIEEQTLDPFPYEQLINLGKKIEARYVRFVGKKPATVYGYSFYEFRVLLAGESVLKTIKLTNSASLVKLGTSIDLNVEAKDQNNVRMDVDVTYEIYPETAGSIDKNGKYTAEEAGLVTITAVSGTVRSNTITIANMTGDNLAFGKESVAGCNPTDLREQESAANDGDENTAWVTYANFDTADEWWYVDLGDVYDITEIAVLWGKDYSTKYILQVRTEAPTEENAKNDDDWKTIATITNAEANTPTFSGVKESGVEARGRYVRLHSQSKSSNCIRLREVYICGNIYTPDFIIYHKDANAPEGAMTEHKGGKINQPIEYRRKFNLDTWYSICFPFEVNRVAVYNEVDGKYYDLSPYYRDADGTYHSKNYIIRRPEPQTGMPISNFQDKTGNVGWLDPSTKEVGEAKDNYWLPKKDTPYIIQFHNEYYKNRWICFFGAAGQTIAEDFKLGAAPTTDDVVNIYGNNTMMPQEFETGFRSYHLNNDGDAWTRHEGYTLNPFECYILASEATTAQYKVLGRNVGGTTTSVDGLQDDEPLSVLRVYTQTGLLLRQYQDITLTYALADMQTTAAEGTYIFVSAGQTWKIMLNGQR